MSERHDSVKWLHGLVERGVITERRASVAFVIGGLGLAMNQISNYFHPQRGTLGIDIANGIEIGAGLTVVASGVVLQFFENHREAKRVTTLAIAPSSDHPDSMVPNESLVSTLEAQFMLPSTHPDAPS